MRARQKRPQGRTRRQLGWLGFACICLVAFHGAVHAQKNVYRLQSVKGRVEIQKGGRGAWYAAKRSAQTASAGDRIRTGPNGAVHIVTSTGQRVALGPNTTVALKEPNKPSGWRVFAGKILAVFTGGKRLEVRAPGAVAAAEGTTFQVDVADDGTTVLTVVEGKVDFYNELGSVVVLESQQSTARPGSAPTRPAVIDPSGLIAWEASLQTLIIEPEYPHVGTDPEVLQQELERRQEALQARQDDPAAQAAVTQVLLDLGRTDEAQTQLEQAVAASPAEASLKGLLGFALLRTGRPEEAQTQLTEAAQAQPDEARWQIGLALVAMGQKDARPAVALLERARTLAPDDPAPSAYLTAVHLRLGDLDAASTAATEAVRLGPDSHLANSYLAYVRLAQGDTKGAVAAGIAAVAAAPASALAHEVLGTTQFFAGNFAEARRALEGSLERDPLSAGAHLTLAKLMAAEDDIDGALDEAQIAVGLNPRSAPTRSALGLLFLLNNDPQRAGREFQKALALDPGLSEARTGWGVVLARRGRFKDALDEQKAALSLDTDSASAHNNLGGVYASLGRMAEAIESLERAIELQPEWGLPYANLALVHLEENRYKEAIEAGETAVGLGERSAFIHTVLARIYVRQGRTDRAMAELRQAVALDETYPQARFQLAKLYLLQDRARDAVRETLAGVTTDPSAMLETRRYARTEVTVAGGNYGTAHFDARHSDGTADGRLSYFASGQFERTDGWRDVDHERSEAFGEVIAGYQPSDRRQLVVWGTVFDSKSDLPGPETPTSLGDVDDSQKFTGYDTVLAYRQRLTSGAALTGKYSFRRGRFRFDNPDSLTGADTNPFSKLNNSTSTHSLEGRLDAEIDERISLRAGFSHAWEHRKVDGIAGAVDPNTATVTHNYFAARKDFETNTSWIELQGRPSERLQITVGGYWGHQEGSRGVVLPKLVAIYRPDQKTWISAMAIPIFRNDVAELSPVEALADPFGLGYLNFVEGGSARSYELRCQRQMSRSANLTTALAYQRVRGLLIDVEDPAASGLPSRILVDHGHRWVADASYEQWLCDSLTGRAWVRWQDSRGVFPQTQVAGTEWPYTPEWQAGGRLDYIDANGFRIGLEGIWVDERFHDPANTMRVGSYPVFNFRAQFQRNLHENYFVELRNLTGRDYVTFAGFPQSDLTVLGGAEYRF